MSERCLLIAPALGALFGLVEGGGESAVELKQALLDAIKRGASFYTVQIYAYPAVGADKFFVRLVPSQGFRRVIAALRAGDFDKRIVEQAFAHDGAPCVDEPQDTAFQQAETAFERRIRKIVQEQIAKHARVGGLLGCGA